MEFLLANWDIALAVFFVLEKVVKLSPTKYDDILLDMVWGGLKKLEKFVYSARAWGLLVGE